MRVDESKAGKSISAYCILDGRGKYVGKILSHYGDSGRVWVNLWDWTDERETKYQEGSAGGYGYDKFTAAMQGMTFAGEPIHDHCGTSIATDRAMDQYLALAKELNDGWGRDRNPKLLAFFKRWRRKGIEFANYSKDSDRYGSAYHIAGVKGIEARGYQVIQLI